MILIRMRDVINQIPTISMSDETMGISLKIVNRGRIPV